MAPASSTRQAYSQLIYLRGGMGNVAITWSDGHQQQRGQERIPMAVLTSGIGFFPTGDPYGYVPASPQLDGLKAENR